MVNAIWVFLITPEFDVELGQRSESHRQGSILLILRLDSQDQPTSGPRFRTSALQLKTELWSAMLYLAEDRRLDN